jgi:hypothetical protein
MSIRNDLMVREISFYSVPLSCQSASEGNLPVLIGGGILGMCIIIVIFWVVRRQKAEGERRRRKEQILAAAGNEKDLVPLTKPFLASEQELFEDQKFLAGVLRVLIFGGSLSEAQSLLTKAVKKYPGQAVFADLEIDLLLARRPSDAPSFERLLLAYQRRPDRKDWLPRMASLFMAHSFAGVAALKLIGEYHKSGSDPKSLIYLAETYDKKKMYTEISLPFYDGMTVKEPKKAKWHYAVARCLQNLGDTPGALTAIQTCFAIDDSYRPAHDLLHLLQPPPAAAAMAPVTPPPADPGLSQTGLPERYINISELGRGGMGIVYKAFDDVLKRNVAIKVLQEASGPNFGEMKARFLSESRVMACLDHPVIPKVFDVSVNSPCYIALEFLEGTDLRVHLTQTPILPLTDMIRAAKELAEGFQHAAEKNVLHRDIKPENMLIEKSNRIRILDFGLAKFSQSQTQLTQQGLVVGTPWYMAPERLKGEPSSIASEIYAFGVTLYELFCGKRPFEGDDFNVIFFQEPRPLTHARPEVPNALEVLVLDCLNKNPSNRPSSFREIAEELAALLK